MKELDEAGMEKSLREKLNSYGRHPSDKVWENIQQRVAAHQKPAPKNRPWLLPLLFFGGLLLLLIGNMLPPVFTSENRNEAVIMASAENVDSITTNSAINKVESAPANLSATINNTGKKAAEAKIAGISNENNQPPSNQKQPAKTTSTHFRNQVKNYLSSALKPARTKKEGAATENVTSEIKSFNESKSEEIFTAEVDVKAESAGIDSGSAENYESENSTAITKNPEVLGVLIGIENEIQQGFAASPEATDRMGLIALVQAEKEELAQLHRRADSLLLSLGEYVPEPLAAEAKKVPGTTEKPGWSAMLAFAPERNFLSLQAPAADTLMERRSNHETGSTGFNASVMVDYRLTDRLSISSGFGYSNYSAELRLTNTETLISTTYDTVTSIHTNYTSSSQTVTSVQLDSALQLIPVLNGSGQVISYDSVFIPLSDTTFFTIERGDTVTTIKQTINPNVSTKEVTTYKVFKPTYHFVTLPVMLRYRLTPGARWWADVAFGAQLQKFTGGTQVITEDGKHFRSERIKASEGPFRQFNLALIGNMAVNYGLSGRLSISAAPALRYQVQSVYKRETGLKQRPLATGLQFGLRYQF